jgi:hypothetical protein
MASGVKYFVCGILSSVITYLLYFDGGIISLLHLNLV